MQEMDESLFVNVNSDLKEKVETYADQNGITQSGAVRMILSEKLNEVES